ncbi:hypothetical protein D3C75_1312580 [compost metagenome]
MNCAFYLRDFNRGGLGDASNITEVKYSNSSSIEVLPSAAGAVIYNNDTYNAIIDYIVIKF